MATARELIISKLEKGYVLKIWRRDDPDFRVCNDLAVDGLVTMELCQIDDQSSCIVVSLKEN